ncbi:aldo/keto reductase [Pararhodobacter marinus]|uniref:aldo/keto reductase n=1 Tax=Pararhodobacter marinus TaxID=2184063 RepID=UPI0035115C33
MKTLTLGPSGPRVPDICLGTMTWGRQTPEDDAHRQIALGLDHGLVFLDTAEMYPTNPVTADKRGGTETVIGNWIARHGGRERMILATKVTGEGSQAMEGGTPMIDAARLRSAVEESLTRLRTDHIDLFQLHWPNRGSYHFRRYWTYAPKTEAPFDAHTTRAHMQAILAEAKALQDEGKIGHLGMSNETAWGLAQWSRVADESGLPRLVSVQNEYSLLCRLFDTDMAETSLQENIPLLAYSPLAAGLLTGKYAGDVTPEGSRRSVVADLGGRITPRVFEAVSAYLGLARDWSIDPVVMALAWHRTRPFTSIPILGATRFEQLEAQIPALDVTLPEGLAQAIDGVHKAHPMPY